ncbi:MAG: aspartate-semialdehyde dehydrogenase, partial [Alphaproteobacteria bacterium]|nr:aspartate-semialdehyde dehydrogenase [Alphaproteobacteria bacterium]
MDELFNQTRGVFVNDSIADNKEVFTKQIAFNVIPHIDIFMDNGATKEEWKMSAETCKILDPSIKVHANCARVPSFIGHAEYINIETSKPIDAKDARNVLKKSDGIIVFDERDDEGYVTQAEAAGEDSVYISRIRKDNSVKNGLSFWCVADNLRKGAALNAVQIAELLIRDYLKK